MVCSIQCALPCCTSSKEEQTTGSLVVRIALVALGIVALVLGLIILVNKHTNFLPNSIYIPIDITGGAILTATGFLFSAAGLCFRRVENTKVKNENLREDPESTKSWLSKNQDSLLREYNKVLEEKEANGKKNLEKWKKEKQAMQKTLKEFDERRNNSLLEAEATRANLEQEFNQAEELHKQNMKKFPLDWSDLK